MKRNQISSVATLVLVTVFFAATAHAELPAAAYDSLRKEANEALIIEVTNVQTNNDGSTTLVRLQANILHVERSRTGLKKGEVVTIEYAHTPGRIGPRPVPVLEKGVYPAFLHRGNGSSLNPAAHGLSFTMTPAQ